MDATNRSHRIVRHTCSTNRHTSSAGVYAEVGQRYVCTGMRERSLGRGVHTQTLTPKNKPKIQKQRLCIRGRLAILLHTHILLHYTHTPAYTHTCALHTYSYIHTCIRGRRAVNVRERKLTSAIPLHAHPCLDFSRAYLCIHTFAILLHTHILLHYTHTCAYTHTHTYTPAEEHA